MDGRLSNAVNLGKVELATFRLHAYGAHKTVVRRTGNEGNNAKHDHEDTRWGGVRGVGTIVDRPLLFRHGTRASAAAGGWRTYERPTLIWGKSEDTRATYRLLTEYSSCKSISTSTERMAMSVMSLSCSSGTGAVSTEPRRWCACSLCTVKERSLYTSPVSAPQSELWVLNYCSIPTAMRRLTRAPTHRKRSCITPLPSCSRHRFDSILWRFRCRFSTAPPVWSWMLRGKDYSNQHPCPPPSHTLPFTHHFRSTPLLVRTSAVDAASSLMLRAPPGSSLLLFFRILPPLGSSLLFFFRILPPGDNLSVSAVERRSKSTFDIAFTLDTLTRPRTLTRPLPEHARGMLMRIRVASVSCTEESLVSVTELSVVGGQEDGASVLV